jgi:hypothetical protein
VELCRPNQNSHNFVGFAWLINMKMMIRELALACWLPLWVVADVSVVRGLSRSTLALQGNPGKTKTFDGLDKLGKAPGGAGGQAAKGIVAMKAPLVLVPPSLAPVTPTVAPVPAPIPILQLFRSDILKQNVSSILDLNQTGTPQFEAFNWLVAEAFLSANASLETIIDRYVLAVLYFADNGLNWTNQCNFLLFASVCTWHNFPNGTGAFCTMMNDLKGNFKEGVSAFIHSHLHK